MKSFLTVSLLAILLVMATASLHAQPYRAAVGLRLGYPTSVSYKQFLGDSHAMEVNLGTRNASRYYTAFSLSGAYLVHKPLDLLGIDNLQFYYGGGAAVYLWNYRSSYSYNNYARTS
ncbi:MAG: hypothetical protein OHK0039_30100 [Bacteroidia bacterium]